MVKQTIQVKKELKQESKGLEEFAKNGFRLNLLL